MLKWFYSFYVFIGFLCCAYGQKTSIILKAQQAVESFASDEELSDAIIGFCMLHAENGKVAAHFNKDKLLIPASSQKLLTSAVMLDIFGEKFQFNTQFFLEGTVTDSCLYGNLLIVGKGDPSLASAQMFGSIQMDQLIDTLAKLLYSKGIHRIQGRVVIDESFIQDIPENPEWLWYDLGNYYGAGCHSLNIYENTALVSIAPGNSSGELCDIVKVVPEEMAYRYCSEVIASQQNSEDDLYALGTSQSEYYTLHGNVKSGISEPVTLKVSIPNPAHSMQLILQRRLSLQGINISNDIILATNKELLIEIKSPELNKIVERALHKSVNLYCESFVHQIGWGISKNTERAAALAAIKSYWKKAGLQPDEYFFVDGSGLSPKNAISARQLSSAMYWYNKENEHLNFHTLLPDISTQGPLAAIIGNSKGVKNKLFLKSGSMERVRSYAGFIVQDGKIKYVLSLMVNNFTCSSHTIKKKMAKFFSELCKL